MLLRTKIVLVLAPVVLGYALLDHLVQRSILRPSFERLEQEQSEQDLERTAKAVQEEIDRLADRAESWSQREGLGRFVLEGSEDYVRENLGDPLFDVEGFSLVYVVDRDGVVLWGEAREAGATEHSSLLDFPRGSLSRGHQLLARVEAPDAVVGSAAQHTEVRIDREGPVQGLMVTERGPLLVASRAIAPLEPGSPSPGRLILGRFLDETTIAEIGDRYRVEFEVWSLSEAPASLGQELLDEVTGSVRPVLRAESAARMVTYGTVNDVRQRPALVLGTTSDRSITTSGKAVASYALLSTMAAGLLMLLVLLRVLQVLVLTPIRDFTEQAVHVGKTDDTTVRIEMSRGDEIGILSQEFDSMLGKLATSRSALVDSARTAGMSEIASGILHNVGNVLNSVGVAGSLVERRLRKSPLAKLDAVLDLLRDHAKDLPAFIASDPRGKQLLPVLESLHSILEKDRVESLEEVDTLNAGLEHIRGLVASQQTYARKSDVREVLKLEEVVTEALDLCERSGAATRHIRFEKEFEELGGIPIDRHKVLEILVNFLRNACQSVVTQEPRDPFIRISIRSTGADTVRVSVTDNGVGIESENLERIFNHGFTTKSDGNGFGLHSAANSAGEMGCRLFAESDGPGHGATFHLELPREHQDESSQAA